MTCSFVAKLNRRTLVILKSISGAIFFMTLFTEMYLYLHYEHTRPSGADSHVGRIYPEHHIGVFYLTAGERDLLRSLAAASFICFFLGVACYQLEKRSGQSASKR
jgi:hypothetical protein